MKYKVGDKVKIRKDLKVGNVYGLCLFTEEMKDFCGKVVNITDVNRMDYCIDSSDCYWTNEMFEGADTEVQRMNKHVGIYIDGNKVIAVNLETGKRGVARCHPDDKFNFYTGAKIALVRLEEAETPFGWLKEGVPYYVPQLTFTNQYDSYTYDADDFDKRNIERGIVFQTKEEAIECTKKMLAAIKQTEV